MLGVVSIALARRGAEDSLRARARLAAPRAPRLAPLAMVFAFIAIGRRVLVLLQRPRSERVPRLQGAARHSSRLRTQVQDNTKTFFSPKITAVDATINIYPERRSFDGTVRMTLENKTNQPIPQIHITDQRQSVSNLQVRSPVPSGEFRSA